MQRLKTVNIFAFIVLGLFLAASGLVAVIIMIKPEFADQTALQTLIIYAVAFGIPSLVYGFYVRRKQGRSFTEIFSLRRLSLKSLLLCVLLGFLIQPLMSLVAVLASFVFTDITSLSMEQMTEMPLPLFILTVGVLPAFFEELVCRGMMLDGYRETPTWYMLIIPALFFGLLHMNFQQISYAFLAGIFLAYLVHVTGSIWASMTVHFVVNGFQSLLAWLMTQSSLAENPLLAGLLGGTEEIAPIETLASSLISAGVVLPFFLLCLYLLRRGGRTPQPAAKKVMPPHWAEAGILMYVVLGLMVLMAVIVEIFMPYMSELL